MGRRWLGFPDLWSGQKLQPWFLSLRLKTCLRQNQWTNPSSFACSEGHALGQNTQMMMMMIWSDTLMELIFNPCGEFRWNPEGPVSQIHSPHLHVGAPGIFSELLKSVQMLKREWGAESNGKLLHLFIPCETVTLVPEFVVKDLPLGRTLWFYIYIYIYIYIQVLNYL